MATTMTTTKRLQWSAEIAAPVARVYELMIGIESYRTWTAAFCEGSFYEGSWQPGGRIRFLSPSGDGMVAEIAENRPHRFISIRHLGFIAKGVEDTESEAVRAWAPACENYSFTATPQGTRLTIDQDVAAEYERYMQDSWPKALAKLKALAEGEGVP
jgi:uncharacterized protein YndB with AHSA1/START domain